jgi:hypothetical protein
MISNESKLCCDSEARYEQAFSYKIHCFNGGCNLVFFHCGGTKIEWRALNLYGFLKMECCHEKNPCPLPFMVKVLDMVVGHEVHSFLNGFFGYHQIMIALENKYKTTFITDLGTFV